MVVDLRLNKKGLLTAEAYVCLSITLLLVTMITSIVQAKYAQHTVFDRTIRKMEESLIEKMKDVEGCTSMSNRKGFALVEVLVAILTVCICIPIIVSVISLMRTSLKDRVFLQDQIALIQLRRYLAVAYEIELLPSSLTFQRQHEEMRLSVVNQNLIVQPGTQIFLMDIETAIFYLEGDSVMLRYVRDNQEYEVFLCKQ